MAFRPTPTSNFIHEGFLAKPAQLLAVSDTWWVAASCSAAIKSMNYDDWSSNRSVNIACFTQGQPRLNGARGDTIILFLRIAKDTQGGSIGVGYSQETPRWLVA